MSDKNISSGCGVFFSHNGETLSLREWAIRWLADHEDNASPSNLEIRGAIAVLSRRMEIRTFSEAIAYGKHKCPARRNKSRSGHKATRQANRGQMIWRDNSGRSMGEMRALMQDNPGSLLEGSPQCGGRLPMVAWRIL